MNDLNFPVHGGDRSLEFRDAERFTFKGAYETNIELGDVKTRIKAGFDLDRFTLRRHNNSLPWDGDPFFDIYGYESTYFNSDTTGKLNAFFSQPYHPLTGALYVQTTFSYKSILFQPGVRFDFVDPNAQIAPLYRNGLSSVVSQLDTTGDASLKFQVSPRIGVSYPITDRSQFRVNFSAMFKMPEFNLLYDNAYGSSQRAGQLFGDPNIEPQKVFQYELGYEAQIADDYYVDVSAYYRDIFNQTGISFVPTLPSPYAVYSVQEYGNVRGLQLGARARVSDNFNVDLNYTLQQARGTASSPDGNYSTVFGSLDPFTGETQKVPLTEFPLNYDQTHSLNSTFTFQWGENSGPSIAGIFPLENTNLTLTGTFATGLPFSKETSRGDLVTEFNSLRLPSQFNTEAHLEKAFKLKDLIGDAVGNLELSFYADVFNLLNTTDPIDVRYSSRRGGARFAIEASPDVDGEGQVLSQPTGNFSAVPFYRDIEPARSETFDALQYDIFGHRMYSVYADANLDGVVTQAEKYEGYQRFVATAQALRSTYQFPRQVSVGFKIRF
jgi:outer membrane receptor protein involved in Fe transport